VICPHTEPDIWVGYIKTTAKYDEENKLSFNMCYQIDTNISYTTGTMEMIYDFVCLDPITFLSSQAFVSIAEYLDLDFAEFASCFEVDYKSASSSFQELHRDS